MPRTVWVLPVPGGPCWGGRGVGVGCGFGVGLGLVWGWFGVGLGLVWGWFGVGCCCLRLVQRLMVVEEVCFNSQCRSNNTTSLQSRHRGSFSTPLPASLKEPRAWISVNGRHRLPPISTSSAGPWGGGRATWVAASSMAVSWGLSYLGERMACVWRRLFRERWM